MKLDDLIAKATREPYPIELPDGTVVGVPQPTVAEWKNAPWTGNVAEVLTALGVGADDAARVSDVVEGAPLGVADQLVADMRSHFGLGN